ncbi:MAG: carboxymuconolactone decarboxylase family protein [Candidatus Krumholzibacteriota bacterium]|nr:carboxymuconolactone decarboxylase family protein [Candidatus Krumholzibacteriota bacterium]
MQGDWKKDFETERARLNGLVFSGGNLGIKRFFALDGQAYLDGALPAKTKELMGLASSMVLRCNDCIAYHIARCREEGVTKEEFYEAFNVALVVGGSIVIPHLRVAAEKMEALFEQENNNEGDNGDSCRSDSR